MIGYEEYVNRLKTDVGAPDFGALRQALDARIAGRRAARARWALAGAVVLLFLGLAAYFTYPLFSAGNGPLYSYVFDQQEISDGPVIDYVFSD